LVREFLSRRIASLPGKKFAAEGTELLTDLAMHNANKEIARDVLAGIQAALQGLRDAPPPKDWDLKAIVLGRSSIKEGRDRSTALSVVLGDERALGHLRALEKAPKADLPRRKAAFKSLVFKHPEDLRGLLGELLDDPPLRSPAIRALAIF